MARTILILGPSGMGKSHSIKDLPPKNTMVINAERKTLPFKDSARFPQIRPKSPKEVMDAFDEGLKQADLRVMVLESFSAFLDLILAEARVMKSGWDVYDYYNKYITSFFQKVKEYNDAGKHIVCIAHDDIDTNELTGQTFISTKVKGKEWKGVIEKEFDMVFHAELRIDESEKRNYEFRTQTDGIVPAKSPEGMFDDILIPNSLMGVMKAINTYDGNG